MMTVSSVIMSAVGKKNLPRKENQRKRKRKISKISEEDVSKVSILTEEWHYCTLDSDWGLTDVGCLCVTYCEV